MQLVTSDCSARLRRRWMLVLASFAALSGCGAPDLDFAEPGGPVEASAEEGGSSEAEDRAIVESASGMQEGGDGVGRHDTSGDEDTTDQTVEASESSLLDRAPDGGAREVDSSSSGGTSESGAESGADVIEASDAPAANDVIDDRRDGSLFLPDAADANGDVSAWNTCPRAPPPQTTDCQGNVPCVARNVNACTGANAFCQTCLAVNPICCVPSRGAPSCVPAPTDCVP